MQNEYKEFSNTFYPESRNVNFLSHSPFSLPFLCLQHNFFLNHLRISFRHDVLLLQVLEIIQSKKTRTFSYGGIVRWLTGKEAAYQCRKQEMSVSSLCQEDLPEEEMATHTRILTRIIPQTEEPGGLLSMWSQRIGCD